MASGKEFVQYIADQLREAGEITYRKMFGEYGMYCDGKIFALICDDQLFVKITEAGRRMAPELSEVPPYEGAKPYFLIENVDDREFLTEFIRVTCEELPMPKPKVSKKRRSGKRDMSKITEEKGKEKAYKNTEKDNKSANKNVGEKKKTFDYKKEFKEYYLPPKKPGIVTIPAMNYIAVRGKGNPNEEDGEYKQSIGLLYAIAFTIKMSYKGSHQIEGYFPYVVPPLEGLWWQEGVEGVDFSRKDTFQWISMIRLPDFVTRKEFDWAIEEATDKKGIDFSKVEFFTYEEGTCVQCMHIGPYDNEPETIRQMEEFAAEQGYESDMAQIESCRKGDTGNGNLFVADQRCHHEIYLSDPRRAAPERLKTVIRQPVKKK